MLEPWELILHHRYAGTPGVAFDHSPGHHSHGRVVQLGPSDFLLDGQANGSGAVRFRRRGRISVSPTAVWSQIGSLSVEVTFRKEVDPANGFLVEALSSFFVAYRTDDSVELGVTTNWATPGASSGLVRFSARLAEFGVDPTAWVQAGFVYDGIATARLYLNGELAKTWTDRPLQPIRPVRTLTIGNDRSGALPFEGLIDEVKIWRPNPNRITADFTERTVGGDLNDCWVRWGKTFRAALDDLVTRDVECAETLPRLVAQARSAIGPIVVHNPQTRLAWEQTIAEYQRLWARGDVAAIGPVLARLLDTFAGEGVPLEQLAAVRELIDSRCLQELLSRTPPPDCDPQFLQMFSGQGS